MVAFLRRFLVVLLVLLQAAVPLVHAHAGNNVARGLHLHEFEALHVVADGLSFSIGKHAADAQSCIVEVGSAINQQPSDHDSAAIFYLPVEIPAFAGDRMIDVINFSPHTAGFVPEPFLAQNTSRAPPL